MSNSTGQRVSAPGIALTLYILGSFAIIVGAIAIIIGISRLDAEGLGIGLGLLVFALMFFALGFGLTKLNEIAFYLAAAYAGTEKVESGAARTCPFCAEMIKAEARICRFCGRNVEVIEPVSKHAEAA